MHLPNMLSQRLHHALEGFTDDPTKFATMVRATTDPSHGDYQVNCAMPLSKLLKQDAEEVAQKLVDQLQLDDLCNAPEIKRGFINLRLKDEFLEGSIAGMLGDARLGVLERADSGSIVIDFSSPNVAKPMHVGHIRSTVIGDSLARTLGFLGYKVITDNHLGDWGTQFGMIIYGYKHFGDPALVDQNPVAELSCLYRIVNQLIEYRKAVNSLQAMREAVETSDKILAQAEAAVEGAEGKEAKKAKKSLKSAKAKREGASGALASAEAKIAAVESDPELKSKADAHPTIDTAVLQETVKLHQGDEENLGLWEKFLPHCKDEINRIYDRLDVTFDHTLGESFYHPMLAGVVSKLRELGLASESDGAVCVFLPEFDAPMIVQKQDGAYLYATTDLATLQYRLQEFSPEEILYVVDTRQSEHFQKLFAVAAPFGLDDIKLVHVNFGTVLGEDGRPMKTRSGSLIGLEGLLNDAVDRARVVVCNPDRLSTFDPPMDVGEQEMIAETVGIGAIKFADLGNHRTSDYRFNLERMIALEGNTSTYVQYAYARSQKILENAEKCESDIAKAAAEHGIAFTHPAERQLALVLVKFEEALLAVHQDYAPNHLVDYMLEVAKAYSKFNENCHVLRAETEAIQTTRLALVTLTGRMIALGLSLLGVQVVPRM